MSEIVALPETLHRMAASLSAAGMQVAGLSDPMRTILDPAAEAAPRQSGRALEQFLFRWGAALRELGDRIDRLGRLVEGSARAYRDADEAMLP
ncbi:MAG: hypothetical protein ACRDKW_09975 [Actinomycetota bacterium]